MIFVKRFSDFTDIQPFWNDLEDHNFHFPFQSFWYNKLFADTFIDKENLFLLGIYEQESLLAIGAFEKNKQTIRFVGMKKIIGTEDVTDFGDLLFSENAKGKTSEIWNEIILFFKKHNIFVIVLDYVREDSPTYLCYHNKENVQVVLQETSPFVMLPKTWEEYLMSLGKKQRHELKRKVNRLEKESAFHVCKEQTIQEDFRQFIILHKLSDEKKDKFMTKDMEKFFWDLITCEKYDWEIHFCSLFIDDQQVASVMAFMNNEQTLLYNSGFNPAYGYFSVGLLVKAFLLKKSLEKGKKVYDFLRGNERYKYDLGAKDRPLYQITLVNE